MQVSQVKDFDTHAIMGGGQAQSFRMAETAEFFTVLSNTLYTNKKRAMIREIVCNAWDAHLMQGCADRPVEIEIDNSQVIVRDHGPGIPRDKIVDVYCVYGASTKVHDEEQTGGFGLGSKAPFAYSDHFTVETCHNGYRSVYTISRGGSETDGRPDIREMVCVPTDRTGVTVNVPVQDSSDACEFVNLAKNIVRQGGMFAQINDEEMRGIDYTEARKTGFGYIEPNHASALGLTEEVVYCLYGTVLYPVTSSDNRINDLMHEIKDKTLSRRDFYGKGVVVLAAKPNAVGVTPSREALSYTDSTIETLQHLMGKFLKAENHGYNRVTKLIHRSFLTGKKFQNDPGNPNDFISETIKKIFDHTSVADIRVFTDPTEIAGAILSKKPDRRVFSDMEEAMCGIIAFAPQHKRAAKTVLNAERWSKDEFTWRKALRVEHRRKILRITRDVADPNKIAFVNHEVSRDTTDSYRLRSRAPGTIDPVIVISDKRYEAEAYVKRRHLRENDADEKHPLRDYRDLRFVSILMNPGYASSVQVIRERAEKFGYTVCVADKIETKTVKEKKPAGFPSFSNLVFYGRRSGKLPDERVTVEDVTHYIHVPGGPSIISNWGRASAFRERMKNRFGDKIALITNDRDLKRVKNTDAVDAMEVLRDDLNKAMPRRDFALLKLIDGGFSGDFGISLMNRKSDALRDILKGHIVNFDQMMTDLPLLELYDAVPPGLVYKLNKEISTAKSKWNENIDTLRDKIEKDERMYRIRQLLRLIRYSNVTEESEQLLLGVIRNIGKIKLEGEDHAKG